jgi:hypothetical protein
VDAEADVDADDGRRKRGKKSDRAIVRKEEERV